MSSPHSNGYTDPYNGDSYEEEEIEYYQNIWREHICQPRKMKRYPSGYVASWAEVDTSIKGAVQHIECMEVISICVSPGSYDEPPDWQPFPLGELHIRPIYKCWGKGKRTP